MDGTNLDFLRIASSILGAIFWLWLLTKLFDWLVMLLSGQKGSSDRAPDATKADFPGQFALSNPSVRKSSTEQTTKRRLEVIQKPPIHIQRAIDEFQNTPDWQSGAHHNFGVERSPLVCFGYRVGKSNGRPETIRHEILEYSVQGHIPDLFSHAYQQSWGQPCSLKRYRKIRSHIEMLVEQRQWREKFRYAVEDWQGDLKWLDQRYHNEFKTRG